MNITDELERHAKQVMPNYPNDVCSRARAEIERLRAALTTARLYIKDEMIANAVVVPQDAKPPFDKHPSLLQVIDAALA